MKVFLKYWHPEQLSLALNQKIKQIITVQKLIRGMLGRKQAERVRQVVIAKKEALSKSFLMSIEDKRAKVTQDLRYLNHHDKDIYKKKVS